MENVLKELRKSFLFKDVSDEDILKFTNDHPCEIISFSKHDCVITREEYSKRIGIVIDGTLGIYSDSFYGGHTLIGIGGPHYLFGFIANFYNNKHSITTLYCQDKCRIAFFNVNPGETAVNFIKTTSPQILSNIYEMMTIHIKDDFDRQQIINTTSVKVKIVRYLLYLYQENNHLELSLKMNRTELSNFLGVYRTSLSRAISKLEKEGIITCGENDEVVINSLNTLIEIEQSSYD